jgi:pimeloyl-ACP methyl ester carboxylesterase
MTATKSIEVLPSFQVETLPEVKKEYPWYLLLAQTGFQVLGTMLPGVAAQLAYRLFATPRIRAVHKVSDELIESARLFEIMYGNILLKCYEWGKGDRVVLLVHGWESRGTAMRSFVPGLLKAGFRVVAFDGPAHGNSGGKRTNLPHFAGAVKAVIHQIGGVHSIITHSFGGATSTFALAHLDQSIEPESLVLIAVPASTRKVVQDFVKLIKLPKSATEAFLKLMKNRVKGIPLEELDVEHALGKVKVQEVLVVHDRHDTVVSYESAEAIFEKWDHVSMLVSNGEGHYRLMRNREVIARVVDFVAAV